jgi:hypothetical protein
MGGKAVKLLDKKARYDDGAIREMVIWQLPKPDSERPHGLKYRLYYGRDGKRLVGYDNEQAKGDHRHFRGRETPYHMVSVERLIRDFMADIEEIRNG